MSLLPQLFVWQLKDLASAVQLLVITGMAGLCGGIFGGKSAAILTINPVGVIVGAAWIALVFMTVRNDWAVMELPVILGLPLCYVMPIFDIVTGGVLQSHLRLPSQPVDTLSPTYLCQITALPGPTAVTQPCLLCIWQS